MNSASHAIISFASSDHVMSNAGMRANSGASSSENTKRARMCPQDRNAFRTYERFQGVRFPPEVQALSHVLDQIDTLLMSYEEALVEAARSGQVDWLRQLTPEVVAPKAVVAAAGNGHLECVDALLDSCFDSNPDSVDKDNHGILLEAAGSAGGNGHLSVLKLLLRQEFYSYSSSADSAAWGALNEAAANGHLDVVKFVVERAQKKASHRQCSLAGAISAGHSSIVEFMLGLDTSWVDLTGSLGAAVDAGQTALANRILDLCLDTIKHEPLMVWLTRRKDCTSAMKYLYSRGHNDASVVSSAFENASKYGQIDMMEFLFSTGRVSADVFDRALEGSVTMKDTSVLSFLCSKKCASSSSINRAFEASSKCEMVGYLYENENISSEAVIAVFKKAAKCGEYFGGYSEEQLEVVKLLHKNDCIPADVMGQALVSAASMNHLQIVKLLRHDTRISAEMTFKAFATTFSRADAGVMKALYNEQRIPVKMVVEAFNRAAFCSDIKKMKQLIQFLPREIADHLTAAAAPGNFVTIARIYKDNWIAEMRQKKLRKSSHVAEDRT